MLVLLLSAPPTEHGIDASEWDRLLVQRVIKRLFGIEYSPQHCGRLLREVQLQHRRTPFAIEELHSLLSKADIARIRKHLGTHNGSRRT
jgi:transposase